MNGVDGRRGRAGTALVTGAEAGRGGRSLLMRRAVDGHEWTPSNGREVGSVTSNGVNSIQSCLKEGETCDGTEVDRENRA